MAHIYLNMQDYTRRPTVTSLVALSILAPAAVWGHGLPGHEHHFGGGLLHAMTSPGHVFTLLSLGLLLGFAAHRRRHVVGKAAAVLVIAYTLAHNTVFGIGGPASWGILIGFAGLSGLGFGILHSMTSPRLAWAYPTVAVIAATGLILSW